MQKLDVIINELLINDYNIYFPYHVVKNGLYIKKNTILKLKRLLHKLLEHYITDQDMCFNSSIMYIQNKKIKTRKLNMYITNYLICKINCYTNIIDITAHITYIFNQFLLMCIIEMFNNNRNVINNDDFNKIIYKIKSI